LVFWGSRSIHFDLLLFLVHPTKYYLENLVRKID